MLRCTYRQDVNNLTGLVALAMVGLWIAYLVPHTLRHRQQLLESRVDDRFSDALRVLAVTDRPGRAARSVDARSRSGATADCGPAVDKRIGLLTPGRGVRITTPDSATGGTPVDRPHGAQDRITADAARRAAQQRAAHAATVARRGAAARRRAVLALVLVVGTAVGWTVTGLTTVSVVAGIAPSVLLVSVLVLGRRAVVAGHASDLAWEQHRRELTLAPARASAQAPAVTGRAVRPSDASTEVFERIVDDEVLPDAGARRALTGATAVVRRSTRTGATAAVGAAADGTAAADTADEWSPVPVPRPTYTLKASAPHREPAPLGPLEGSTAVRAESAAPLDAAAGTSVGAATGARAPIEPPATSTGSINLDEILARRRAAGE